MKAISGSSVGAVTVLILVYVHSCLSQNSLDNGQNTQNNDCMPVDELVYMEISIGGNYTGRIVFGLFTELCPLTVANFKALIEGNTVSKDGVPLTYKNSIFHRTIKSFMIQGGDILYGNGYGFVSMFSKVGEYFADEPCMKETPHFGAGWLGMANAGPDTNGCQIYITCVLTPWLDYKHVIFGVVISGMPVVRAIENNPTGANDKPILTVRIEDCGVLPMTKPICVARAPVKG